MAKAVAFDVDARQGLRKGIDIVAHSVRITLGPKGRNVVLEKKFGAPTVTNDGQVIAEELGVKLDQTRLEQLGRARLVKQVRKAKPGHGYDALADRMVDMFGAGIVDPAKVTRSALQNAASIAAMVLTTEAVITEIPEKRASAMPSMPDM